MVIAAFIAPSVAVSARETANLNSESAQLRVSCGRRCGVERWQIKTLSDLERGRVDLTPVRTTIEALISLKRPAHTPSYSRIWPTEFTTYQIEGYLGGYRPESDGDVHLIMFGLENQRASMVVEIPDPRCSGACESGLSSDFAKARETLNEILAQPNPTDQPIVIRVTGVGFFDRNHGQIGAAPNIIELHPVLKLELVSRGDPAGARRR
jgi:hypothetical protein